MGVIRSEKNISTSQFTEKTDTRFQSKDEYERGKNGFKEEESKGEKTADCIIKQRFTLKKREKLIHRWEFETISREGEKRYSSYFVILIKKNDLGIRRLGITITKKVANATKRNRIKRLLREFFRQNKNLLPESCDCLFIAKQGMPVNTIDYADIYEDLQFLLNANCKRKYNRTINSTK